MSVSNASKGDCGSTYWKLIAALDLDSGPAPAPAQTYSGIVSSRHDCSFPAEPDLDSKRSGKDWLLVGSERESAGGSGMDCWLAGVVDVDVDVEGRLERLLAQ